MTVMNLNPSDLSEAYGESFTKSSKKKKSKRSGCDATRKKPAQFDDIISDFYHPSLHGIYEKSRYSRNQHALPMTDSSDREEDDKYVNFDEDDHDTSIKPQLENYQERTPVQNNLPSKLLSIHDEREKRYIDLSMYIFSGIALIFIMEQFINLGVALKQ